MRIEVNIPNPSFQCKRPISSPELTILCEMVQDQLDELFPDYAFSVRIANYLTLPRFITPFTEYTREQLLSLYCECLSEWMQLVS